MSLRTDYTGALDIALAAARAAGVLAIDTTNLAAIQAAMTAAAGQGTKTFTVTITATHQPTVLRSEGPLWDAYRTGIIQALSIEDLMGSDVSVAIDLSDAATTSVSLNFTF